MHGAAGSRWPYQPAGLRDLVLLQPELIDVYAGAIVNAARDEPDGLGSMLESRVLEVGFRLPAQERITNRQQEKLLIIATLEELTRHEIVLREETEDGVQLVFPAAFRRDLPEAVRLYRCPDCGTPFSTAQVEAALSRGRSSLLCPVDETRVALDDSPAASGLDAVTRQMNASADAARSLAAASSEQCRQSASSLGPDSLSFERR
jgi:hypothetical protein